MGYYDNNGFWDDLCEVDKCYEMGTHEHAGRVYCDAHWSYYASVLGLEELADESVTKAEWADEDEIRSRGLGVILG
jgi:hypothetical protein